MTTSRDMRWHGDLVPPGDLTPPLATNRQMLLRRALVVGRLTDAPPDGHLARSRRGFGSPHAQGSGHA
jgi:hypothetical protein